MNDYDKALSIDNGLIVDEENSGPFLTGGVASPIGLDLPTETIYLQPTSGGTEIWRKFGVGVNDWRKYLDEKGVADATSKVVKSFYKVGATSNPSTSANSSGSSTVLAEMDQTFVPETDTNEVDVFFSGTFTAEDAKKSKAVVAIGIFINGVLQSETVRQAFVEKFDEKPQTLATQWSGSLPESSQTVDIRFWREDNKQGVVSIGVQRNLTIKEVEK